VESIISPPRGTHGREAASGLAYGLKKQIQVRAALDERRSMWAWCPQIIKAAQDTTVEMPALGWSASP
jgi:hypothetical protein